MKINTQYSSIGPSQLPPLKVVNKGIIVSMSQLSYSQNAKPEDSFCSKCIASVIAFFKWLFCCTPKESLSGTSQSQKPQITEKASISETRPIKGPASTQKFSFSEVEEELNKRKDLFLRLKEDAPQLHYEGMNPLQCRLEIIKGLKELEKQKEILLDLCKKKNYDKVAEVLATKMKFTVHTEFTHQVEEVIANTVDAFKEAYHKAKDKGQLDTFLIKGFCDKDAMKPDGAPYDIEACLEAKLTQWRLWQ